MLDVMDGIISLVGGFNPSQKYESQLGCLFPIYGKVKNVPKHQAVSGYPLVNSQFAIENGHRNSGCSH